MQLKTQTDYAIRVLLYLANKKSYCVAKDISSNLGIAETYLPKIIKQLREIGWITSYVGVSGGYTLIKDPKEITLFDIMTTTEDTMKINRCLDAEGYCSRSATDYCEVHKVYNHFQQVTEEFFSSITIADLLSRNYINSIHLVYGEREMHDDTENNRRIHSSIVF